VLVTGASGLVGRKVVAQLATDRDAIERIVALDLRPPEEADRIEGVAYVDGDIRDRQIGKHMEQYAVDAVVHLAAVVTPGPESSRQIAYEIDVLGTQNVLDACVRAGVRQVVYTSSGAAYGYHADNPEPLGESDSLRGNESFGYAWNKRIAEETLARYRSDHPELGQLIFRCGTILGERVASPITALFERSVIVGVQGSDAPFVLVWDEDVAACIVKGIREQCTGIFNLCGTGAIALPEIAHRLGKPYLPLPPRLLGWALHLLRSLGISARGPEQVDFLRYRPVLSNAALIEEFGFTPRFDSDGCFEHYRKLRFGSPRTSRPEAEPVQ
jgi:UDP-glucose 4-epimerase